MADIYLDIRDRHIRTIVSDSGQIRFQNSYPVHPAAGGSSDEATLPAEGELARVIAAVRADAATGIEQAHLIIPSSEVATGLHKLPRMPQEEVRKLLTRKAAGAGEDDDTRINLIPMDHDQSQQEWLSERVSPEVLKKYKKELSAGRVKLKSVTSVLDATLYAVSHIRESIFNAHAVYEITPTSIEAYYLSSTCLLQHETIHIAEPEDGKESKDQDRVQKRQMFAILDLLHKVNSRYQSSHSLTPLEKVWICGSHPILAGLPEALQDAMDVEAALLPNEQDAPYAVLQGYWKASLQGIAVNLVSTDLMRRFPLRKRTGMIIYTASILLTLALIASTEYRIKALKQQSLDSKKSLAALKTTQTASPAFIKNLDLLRSLTGKQVLFYPIFRELAFKLPDGAYLDSFDYHIKDNRNLLALSVTFTESERLGEQKTLSKLMETLDFSTYLHSHQEPTIVSQTKNGRKSLNAKFLCEVNASDTTK